MNGETAVLSARAGDLRRAFDQGFASPPAPADNEGEGVLAICAGGEACAVPLGQTHGLFADAKVVALPGRLPAFMGITCLRSGIVAVYSLRTFFGHPPAGEPMRWLLLAGGRQQPFALAFEAFDAYARLPPGAISVSGRGGHIQGSATIAGERRATLSLVSIAAALSAKP